MKALFSLVGISTKKLSQTLNLTPMKQDFALAGNGIENIDTLVIPETQR